MTDRELLELAAKAAGLDLAWPDGYENSPVAAIVGMAAYEVWNPLTDDGDALRLLAALKLNLAQGDFSAQVDDEDKIEEAALVPSEDKRAEVLRRLIVRAAAEIGKAA